jgi:hypothetical protein
MMQLAFDYPGEEGRRADAPPTPTSHVMWASWPERFANLERVTGRPSYLKLERDGWVTGAWVLGPSYKRRVPYHGAYPGNLLRRIDAVFFDRQRVLHVFSGMVDTAAFPGDTLDINPAVNPTHCVDAETCEGVALDQYDFALCDPPYTDADAAIYGTRPISRSRVLRTLIYGIRPGGFVVWLDEVTPSYKKDWPIKWEAIIAISTSHGHRTRALFVYRKTA